MTTTEELLRQTLRKARRGVDAEPAAKEKVASADTISTRDMIDTLNFLSDHPTELEKLAHDMGGGRKVISGVEIAPAIAKVAHQAPSDDEKDDFADKIKHAYASKGSKMSDALTRWVDAYNNADPQQRGAMRAQYKQKLAQRVRGGAS